MVTAERFAEVVSISSVSSNLRTKSVRGALLTAAGAGIDLILRLGSTLILARILVPSDFGLVGMVTAITLIIEQLTSLGLSTATVQAPRITHHQCSNLFWTNVAAGLAFAALICGAAPFVAAFYHEERLTAIAMVISTCFLWGGSAVQHEALLNRQMRQPEVAGVRLFANCISAIVAVILAIYGWAFWALVWREVIRSILVAASMWWLFPWLPSLPSRGAQTGKLLRFGLDMTFTQILILIAMRLDTILIGKIAGPAVLGFYRAAQTLLTPIEQLNGPIQGVSQPGLSTLQTEPDRYRRYYASVLSIVGMLTMPLGTFCAIYAEDIVQAMLGSKWTGTAVFLQIVAVGAILRPAIGTSAIVLITCGQHKMLLKLAIGHSVVLALLIAAGIPWGGVGIAMAHLLATVLLMLPKLYFSFLRSPVSIGLFFRSLLRPVLATGGMGVALMAFRRMDGLDGAWGSLIAGGSVAFIVFLSLYLMLPGGAEQIKGLIRDVLESFKRQHRFTKSEPAVVS